MKVFKDPRTQKRMNPSGDRHSGQGGNPMNILVFTAFFFHQIICPISVYTIALEKVKLSSKLCWFDDFFHLPLPSVKVQVAGC